jgi:CheY-like chemotaxis protein
MSAHILVIEDEPETAAFLTEVLQHLGYEVTVARNGEEALDQIHTRAPSLALVDLVMPGIGGWELVRRIRQDRTIQQVPILICTAHRGARTTGGLVQGTLYKPFGLEEIAEKVRDALAHAP